MAFLLVTFLWPRKEKSLAPARRAGETPSRTASSHPAWRSHAIYTWDDTSQINDVTRPLTLTLTLSRRGRGDGYRGAMRFAYCTLPFSRRGERMVTADDYASLIDPTRPYSTRFDLTHCLKRRIRMGAWAKPRRLTGHPSRVKPSYLAAGVGDRLGSAKDAAAPDCRRHLAPLTIHEYSGPTEAHDHLTEPASAGPSKSMKLVMQPSELNGFSPLLQSSNRRLTQVRCVMEGEPQAPSPKPQAPSPEPRAQLIAERRYGDVLQAES